MRDFVVQDPQPHGDAVRRAGGDRACPPASQPLLNWKLRQFAAHRRDSDPKALRNDTDPPPVVPEIPKYPGLHQEAAPRWAALIAESPRRRSRSGGSGRRARRYEASFARFASVFPDAFYVTSAAAISRTIRRTRAGC